MTAASQITEARSRNILIIENDTDLLELLEEIFVHEGFQVRCLQETDDILRVLEDFNADLILVDYLLPGINGGELCAQVKRNSQTSHIPVIILSAYSQVLLSLGSYGCNAFVAKPFELKELVKEVNDCIADPSRLFDGKHLEKSRS
ncbi:response regulator [Pedobacter metabolipauper]|uniref:Two-component system alkaline phosphatase synthesis response regulator PhoP n=1 Tax=Pedobacter metabolipauper TaxID=425513 RepID=A0A4R6T0N7_9SPHI|nr:response regulator [Pedobacter metabolipauper]TDQ11599.1 two-component system alkaline phosphatase synthesis response regulator PhoP [Pedobacter metabolipauper]